MIKVCNTADLAIPIARFAKVPTGVMFSLSRQLAGLDQIAPACKDKTTFVHSRKTHQQHVHRKEASSF